MNFQLLKPQVSYTGTILSFPSPTKLLRQLTPDPVIPFSPLAETADGDLLHFLKSTEREIPDIDSLFVLPEVHKYENMPVMRLHPHDNIRTKQTIEYLGAGISHPSLAGFLKKLPFFSELLTPKNKAFLGSDAPINSLREHVISMFPDGFSFFNPIAGSKFKELLIVEGDEVASLRALQNEDGSWTEALREKLKDLLNQRPVIENVPVTIEKDLITTRNPFKVDYQGIHGDPMTKENYYWVLEQEQTEKALLKSDITKE